MKKSRIIFLDTETTGVDTIEDEILQLAIVDADGNVLLNEYYKPQRHESWPKAERVNHISPARVAYEKPIDDSRERIEQILNRADVIGGYNTQFDIAILNNNGINVPDKRTVDVMLQYRAMNTGTRWRLCDCAAYFGYTFHAHDALNDARATAYCFWQMHPNARAKRNCKNPILTAIIGAFAAALIATSIANYGMQTSGYWLAVILAIAFSSWFALRLRR